jgi:primosomal protein N' (replication factor Y)
LPPFGRLAGIVVTAADKALAEAHGRALAQTALRLIDDARPEDRWEGLSLLGPAEAPIALIRGKHRFRLLARGPREADLQGFLRSLIANGPKERGGVRVGVDVDPVSFV